MSAGSTSRDARLWRSSDSSSEPFRCATVADIRSERRSLSSDWLKKALSDTFSWCTCVLSCASGESPCVSCRLISRRAFVSVSLPFSAPS